MAMTTCMQNGGNELICVKWSENKSFISWSGCREVIKNRKTPIKSFLLDMNLLSVYWACSEGDVRFYHHTPPINLFYAMREALTFVVEEGLESFWKRHAATSTRLQEGIKGMGLELFVQNPKDRLPTVTTIKVPEGLDWKAVTKHAMEKWVLFWFCKRKRFVIVLFYADSTLKLRVGWVQRLEKYSGLVWWVSMLSQRRWTEFWKPLRSAWKWQNCKIYSKFLAELKWQCSKLNMSCLNHW